MTNTTTVKAPRVTLNTVFAPEVVPVLVLEEGQTEATKEQLQAHKEALVNFYNQQATILINTLFDKADYKVAFPILAAAQKLAAPMLKTKEAEERAAAEALAAQTKQLADDMAKAALLQEETKKKVIEFLEQSGLSPEGALRVYEAQYGTGAAGSQKKVFDRVKVNYKGKIFETTVRGNRPQEVKDMIAESGLNAEDFIKTYAVA